VPLRLVGSEMCIRDRSELGRIPVRGDEIRIENGVLKVERMDGRRVDRVRFTPDELEVSDDR
jgi:CBS domain containing-hemolysin-like protein